jgi:hypothetical protein
MTTKDELKAKLAKEKKQLLERQKDKLAKFDKSVRKSQNRKKIILGAVVLKLIAIASHKNLANYLKTHLNHLSAAEKELFPELFTNAVESNATENTESDTTETVNN